MGFIKVNNPPVWVDNVYQIEVGEPVEGGPNGPVNIQAQDLANRDEWLRHNSVPLGAIIMWSGKLSEIPSGWALCDGKNGRPNLLDKFICGVPNDTTDPGTTGGAHVRGVPLPSHAHGGGSHYHGIGNHSHTMKEWTHWHLIPAHSHTASGTCTNSGDHTHWTGLHGYGFSHGGNAGVRVGASAGYTNIYTNDSGNHSHSVRISINQTAAHNSLGCTLPNGAAIINDGGAGNTGWGGSNTAAAGTPNASMDVRPAFYTLAFIIKISYT